MTWRDAGFVALLVLLTIIAVMQLWRAIVGDRALLEEYRKAFGRVEGRAQDAAAEWRGLLEGVRADCIAYQRTAEGLGRALEKSHDIIRMAIVNPDPRFRGSTPGALALRQLEALKANGSAGYYGKRDVQPNGDHGRAPWLNGATVPHAAHADIKADPALVEKWGKVSGAIAQRAGGDRGLWRHLRSVADELLAAGVDHDDVAKRILAGDTADV